ncbi:VOC family protein [Actinoplanes sp. CA-142083]|uniref:VOC family protein n=1 Tax=Actinoplanes sp. CA-142083 TaxID=3239903 RepID=UPI003D92C9C0
MSLQLTDSVAREPVRLHLDLYTDAQAAQVERLVELGATRVDDWRYPDNADFVVLRDPEGNEFCVIGHAQL